MPAATPRLRLFAGPNGSGKSTIKELLPSDWLGVYVNADDIEKRLRQDGSISLSEFEIELTQQDWISFVRTSTLLAKAGLVEEASRWRVAREWLRDDSQSANRGIFTMISAPSEVQGGFRIGLTSVEGDLVKKRGSSP